MLEFGSALSRWRRVETLETTQGDKIYGSCSNWLAHAGSTSHLQLASYDKSQNFIPRVEIQFFGRRSSPDVIEEPKELE